MDQIDDIKESARNRRGKRSLVLLAAKVRIGDSTLEVRLRNLSQNGALLEAAKPPAVGTELMFERGQTSVGARVAWVAENRFGVEFLVPIEESEVLVHVGRAKPAQATPPQANFRRSGLGTSVLKPGERKLAEAWARPGDRALD